MKTFTVERRSGGMWSITDAAEITPSRATATRWAQLANAEERTAERRRRARSGGAA
jgi:hypothetical protein